VTDDGCGFDPADEVSGSSLGLAGLRERAQLIGAQLDLRRRPEGGTVVSVALPLGDLTKERRAWSLLRIRRRRPRKAA
jgi:nitrate/nitrite-specific signal transduction histidine kinase